MNGVVLGVCLTTVSYILISKLMKQKDSAIRGYIDSSAEKMRDYLDKFIKEKENKQSDNLETNSGFENKKNKLFQKE